MPIVLFRRTRRGAAALLSFLSLITAVLAHAQIGTNRIEGLRDHAPRWHALTGATIVVKPGEVIEKGTLVVRDGRIVAVGANVAVPTGARVWKLDGHVIYAGFIDLASSVGVPAALRPTTVELPPWLRPAGLSEARTPPPALAPRPLAAANRTIRTDVDVAALLELKADEVRAARELGFATVLAAPATEILRGQSALINLGETGDAKSLVLAPRVAQHVAFGDRSFGAPYPNSTMGAIALIRQTFYDARWYAAARQTAGGERAELNVSLDALQATLTGKQPVIFDVAGEQDFLRAARLRDEFGLRAIFKGNGSEYRRATQLKTLAAPLIVPINFPAPPEVENPDTALDVGLERLQHWEQAPSNLATLKRAGLEFAVTTAGLRDMKEFWTNLRLAVKRGLPAQDALAALTIVPAKTVGMQTQLGSIEPGRLANLVIASGDLFASETAEVETVFVEGRPYATTVLDRADVRGTWNVTAGGKTVEWKIAGTRARPTLSLDGNPCEFSVRVRQVSVQLPCLRRMPPGASGATANSASAGVAPPATERETVVADLNAEGDVLTGTVQTVTGPLQSWAARRTAAFAEKSDAAKSVAAAEIPLPPPADVYPAGAFGIAPPERPATLFVRNATIWTSGPRGKLEAADLLVRDGKIAAVGKGLVVPAGATVIDATGKHVTAGLIDAHSHTAVAGGINEGTSSITAEVRIGDVIDATNVSIYRQLAGGVTAANVLHGSANTIGGQNQVLKFRWGSDAEGLKFAGAKPGIKFALGENVKQSNWDNAERGVNARYPQTRLGVEQLLRDAFRTARHYRERWNAHRADPKNVVEPRRDLQLDTLVEILEGKRIVHIHSYRADEILMFARLAQEFKFTVGTFQHVLEGYKVADAIANIGAGGSTFSDWWAYKMEVYDAIPYNGALMHRAGVVVSFNSDSDELARRLNTEAAKAVKYGGLGEAEALHFVTINPAKQLRIDDRVGSLEPGKDADFVIWNGHPLSSFSTAEETWIDGRRYFDRRTDAALREAAARERARLVAKALPQRLARVSAPAGRPGAGTAGESPPGGPPTVSDVLAFLSLHREAHFAKQYRTEYWDGGSWHECTEDAR